MTECAKLKILTKKDKSALRDRIKQIQGLMTRETQIMFEVSEIDEIKLFNTRPELFDSNGKLIKPDENVSMQD